MKKLIASLAVAGAMASGIALAAPANAGVQGGHAGDHYWIKVWGEDAKYPEGVCSRVIHDGGWEPCDRVGAAAHWQYISHPDAHGYWAEWYPKSGQTRAGTW